MSSITFYPAPPLEEADACPICFDSTNGKQADRVHAHQIPGQSGWFHPIHETCLNQWKSREAICPSCAREIAPQFDYQVAISLLGSTALASLITLLYQHVFLQHTLDSQTIAFTALGPALTSSILHKGRTLRIKNNFNPIKTNLTAILSMTLALRIFSELTECKQDLSIYCYYSLGACMANPFFGLPVHAGVGGGGAIILGAIQLSLFHLQALCLHALSLTLIPSQQMT